MSNTIESLARALDIELDTHFLQSELRIIADYMRRAAASEVLETFKKAEAENEKLRAALQETINEMRCLYGRTGGALRNCRCSPCRARIDARAVLESREPQTEGKS